jgi:acetyl-CoA carboxylase biotin carboxyl carrier protein
MAKFEMDTEFVRKLAKLLEETNLGEIELADGNRRIRVGPVRRVTSGRGAGMGPRCRPAPPAAAGRPAAQSSILSKHPGRRDLAQRRQPPISPPEHDKSPTSSQVVDKVTAGQTLPDSSRR